MEELWHGVSSDMAALDHFSICGFVASDSFPLFWLLDSHTEEVSKQNIFQQPYRQASRQVKCSVSSSVRPRQSYSEVGPLSVPFAVLLFRIFSDGTWSAGSFFNINVYFIDGICWPASAAAAAATAAATMSISVSGWTTQRSALASSCLRQFSDRRRVAI